MAIIGCLGDVLFFSAARHRIMTLEGMKWESSAKYTVHERHLKEPLLEFTGQGAESISFSIVLSELLGVDPMEMLEKLLTAERTGRIMRLILGTHAYGTGMWVIEKLSIDVQHFDKTGKLHHIKVSLSLKSYATR